MKISKARLKIYLPLFLLILLAVLVVPLKQLSPIGFSKCGRVWNQVEDEERLVTYLLRSYPGSYEVEINLESTDYIFFKYLPDDLKSLWAVGTNNPQCFSQTQRIYIQKIGETEFINTIAKELIRSIRFNSSFQGTGAGSVTVRLGKYLPISQN